MHINEFIDHIAYGTFFGGVKSVNILDLGFYLPVYDEVLKKLSPKNYPKYNDLIINGEHCPTDPNWLEMHIAWILGKYSFDDWSHIDCDDRMINNLLKNSNYAALNNATDNYSTLNKYKEVKNGFNVILDGNYPVCVYVNDFINTHIREGLYTSNKNLRNEIIKL